jgi:hypothetical protein
MYQFDAGTHAQTLAAYGNGILELGGNVAGGLSVIVQKIKVCPNIAGVDTDAQAIAWLNSAVPGTPRFEEFLTAMAWCYNGCSPSACGNHAAVREKYRAGAQELVNLFGWDYWYAPNDCGSGHHTINGIRAKVTRIQMRDQGCMLRAYRKSIVEAIVASGETSTFIPALAYSYSADPAEVEVEHAARAAGESKYRLYDLVRLNFDLMTGFSMVPLQVFTLFGIIVSVLSLLFVAFLLVRRLIVGPEAEGVFTLFAILYFLVGIGIMGLGIIGEYIGRIYKEVRRRPRFVVRAVYEDLNA